jgi:ectoine hydroxylase-related dioxygenase (phytanoyl-CoA dioxygenase family)
MLADPVWQREQCQKMTSPAFAVNWQDGSGDVIFWHCFLCHTGSANIRQVPRFGVFARWSHKEKENMRYEIPADLWKYWSI